MYPSMTFLIITMVFIIVLYLMLRDIGHTASIVSAVASCMLVATYLTNMDAASEFTNQPFRKVPEQSFSRATTQADSYVVGTQLVRKIPRPKRKKYNHSVAFPTGWDPDQHLNYRGLARNAPADTVPYIKRRDPLERHFHSELDWEEADWLEQSY